MLATLQRLLIVALAGMAMVWLWHFWADRPVLAIAGFFAILLAYSGLFVLEFLLLLAVGLTDRALRPTVAELCRAWLGETLRSPQVFFWQQPFRAGRYPDQLLPAAQFEGRRGVVFIHGFFCNRGFWNPWLNRLQGQGHAFVAPNLEPVFGSIDDYIAQIDAAVSAVTRATGLPPLLVCHSMGGLAARAWLSQAKADSRVHHIVTIGTPHHGTWLAQLGFGENSRQMRLQSEWHSGLDKDMPEQRNSLFTCWYSNADNMVFPMETATLDGANNRLIRAVAHVELAFLPEVIHHTLGLLESRQI